VLAGGRRGKDDRKLNTLAPLGACFNSIVAIGAEYHTVFKKMHDASTDRYGAV